MAMQIMEIVSLILSTVIGLAVTAIYRHLAAFIKDQHEVNEANRLANRSMQRDVLFRYYKIIVEQGTPVTPEEFSHIEQCYSAYHENGGNGTGTLMWEKIHECVRIDTGRN